MRTESISHRPFVEAHHVFFFFCFRAKNRNACRLDDDYQRSVRPDSDGPARLPPTIESANEQLLAQAPSLMQDLVPDTYAAHSHGVSATVEELPDHQSVLKLHVPAAVDSDASPSLCDAVSLYVNGRCKQDFQAGVAEDGMVCVVFAPTRRSGDRRSTPSWRKSARLSRW